MRTTCKFLIGGLLVLACAQSTYAVDASGGTVTESGGYRIHTFTSSGTLTVGGGGNVEVLVVAGGGGGGSSIGAGGGAGGLIYSNAYPVSPGSVTVTIGTGGAGGAAGGASVGSKGTNSVFGTLQAYGGGGGGGNGSGLVPTGGGSGGGSSAQDGQAFGGSATNGQGNAGGDGPTPPRDPNYGGGGGGGAGGPGTNGTSTAQGHGGIGLEFPQFASVGGSPAGWFAGGGAGGSYNGGTQGLGGKGGGGNGGATSGDNAGSNGVVNTGGGGGSGNYGTYKVGGSGGSGIVIVRYLLPVAEGTISIDVTPGTGSWTITSCPGGYTGPTSGTGDLATTNAAVGSYTVHYNALSGYSAPADQTQSVSEGTNTAFTGTYTALTYGTLSIDVTPNAASWTITSHPAEYTTPLSGTGDVAATTAVVGSYTVHYQSLANYIAPADQTLSVSEGTNTAFTGTYTYNPFTGTGGNATNDVGGYRIHKFTSDGTFHANAGGNVEVLVVAGGGGGGGAIGGGGGAGGLRYSNSYAVSVGDITVTVGTGGVAGAANNSGTGGNGNASAFGALSAVGGGGGGAQYSNPSSGGSGGGSSAQQAGAGANGTNDQGSAGGDGIDGSSGMVGGGGGGGAGGVGTNGTQSAQGHGGIGKYFAQFASVSGSPAGWFAGGGAGGSYYYSGTQGQGGDGGGGDGGMPGTSNQPGDPGLDGTGGGGGSGHYRSGFTTGGKGGSGIVLVRYLIPITYGTLSIDVTPGTGSWTITSCPAAYGGPTNGTGDLAATNAAVGSYTVTYGTLAGYSAPAPQTLPVAESANTAFSGTYVPITYGTLSINVTPNAASWTISSCPPEYTTPLSGTNDLAPTTAPVGSYTVHYNALENYAAPADQTLPVTESANTAFSGAYTLAPCVGGNTTNDIGGYRIHTFTGSGTFTVGLNTNLEVLVVAGGGGGGSSIGAGGGAGGLIYSNAYPVSPGPVTVTIGTGGAGGAAGGASVGSKGTNSVFGTLQAYGGGGGGGNGSGLVPTGGGSGGGSSAQDGQAFGGSATNGQGNAGGDGIGGALGNVGGGGGGGAGGPGTNGTSTAQGHGGVGLEFPQFTAVGGSPAGWFAGGGAGGSYNGGTQGFGGKGGGGDGGATSGDNAGSNGVVNTGGGGGSGNYGSYKAGGSGGSGIVIVRYLLPVVYGTLSIDVTPNSGSWTMTSCPPAYTGPTNGTGDLAATVAAAGSYTVLYGALLGYHAPAQQTLSVTEDANTAFSGAYVPKTYGTLSINVTPATASWTITSHPPEYTTPLSGVGNQAATAAVEGSYTVHYETLAGYHTPADQTLSVTGGANTAFNGVYASVVKYVNVNATGANNGLSWGDAYTSLTGALAAAINGDELWVAAGTYRPGTQKSDRFNLKSGVAVYGGFSATETTRGARDWANNATVLSGDLSDNDTPNWGNRGDNVTNVVYASTVSGAVLDGFTVRGGYSTGAGDNGAGLCVNNSTCHVANCVFTDNYTGNDGGGLYFYSTSGSYTEGRLENCLVFTNCAARYGGGVDVYTGNNEGQPSPVTIVNCTIWGNTANGNRGGGVYCQYAQTYITNSIVWGNFKTNGVANNVHMQGPTTVVVAYSDASDSSGGLVVNGGGNLNWPNGTDPLLENAAGGDFHLTSGSPCRDSGTSVGAPATDLDGVTRDVTPDIGAYEYVTPLTVTINQALGQSDPANYAPINFTVVFSAAVSDFATGDVTLSGTAGATTAVVTGGGTTYNVAVSGMTDSGTVMASIQSGKAHAAAGNPNDASTSTDNTVTYMQPVTVIKFQ